MAKFTFKNITADRKAVNGTYDAPINPTLGYSVDNEATLGFAEDFDIAAGDVKIPVYDHGFHGYAVVHPGEAFVADAGEDAAAIAFYSEVACQLNKGDCVEAKVEGVEPHTPESI